MGSGLMYHCKTEFYENTVPVREYIEDCVDVPKFLSYCRHCDNYSKTWSCPSFSFDPVDFWNRYETLRIVGMKIIVPETLRAKTYDGQGKQEIIEVLLKAYKQQFDEYIYQEEKKTEGGMALGGGSCMKCRPKSCSRLEGKPCRKPDKMRYSIEALGGDVGRTVTKYLHQELQWMEDGSLPEHFMLVGGVLS